MDIHRIKRAVKNKLGFKENKEDLKVKWFKKNEDSWLFSNFSGDLNDLPPPPQEPEIESLALQASQLGEMPLWKGFEDLKDYPFPVKNATRNANQVRIGRNVGRFFYHLVSKKDIEIILEIGTAFGVSGMYWLSGIKNRPGARLLTFDPNDKWANVAKNNLSSISDQFDLCISTFEEKHLEYLTGKTIDLAFIDAIHTSEIVNTQYALVKNYTKEGSIIIFDDIEFSNDMWQCWKTIAGGKEVRASFSLSDRIGVVELN